MNQETEYYSSDETFRLYGWERKRPHGDQLHHKTRKNHFNPIIEFPNVKIKQNGN